MEIWKRFKDEKTGIQLDVSSTGLVKSVKRVTSRGAIVKPKILKTQLDRCGYPRIRTGVGKVKASFRIHRMVAMLFIPLNGCFDDYQVNHKDGNKTNNNVSNLEWVTNQENALHAYKIGLQKKDVGRFSIRGKYTTFALDKTNTIVGIMVGNDEMKYRGFDYRLVHAVVSGKRNTHRGCTFKQIEFKVIKNEE
ncbi:HNH endonuclease [Aeromonas phage ZPAH1]|nr:HNH endonuclease [Aeromonas phage ZPAH1]